MAGGMSGKRPDAWIRQERVQNAPAPTQPILPGPAERGGAAAPPLADATVEPPPLRHCWVTDEHGRLPGLLLEWRRTVSGWQGRVVRPVLVEGCWVVVEEWLPAAALQPA